MMYSSLTNNRIQLTTDAADAAAVARIQGATRTAKMPPLTWALPFTLDNIAQLRAAGAEMSPELTRAAQDAEVAARYVERMKAAERVEPLVPIPVKSGTTLYAHQVKAHNIALVLFGYRPKGE